MSALNHAGYKLETVRLLEESSAVQIEEIVSEAEAAAIEEASAGEASYSQLSSAGGLFERLLLSRADWLSRMLGLPYHQQLFEQQATRVLILLAACFFLLGLFAASQAFDRAEGTVNFYWLLVVLLGINMLMLLFWMGVMLSRLVSDGVPGRFLLYPAAIWLVQKAASLARHASDSAPDLRALPADPAAHTQAKPLDSMLYGRFWTRLQTTGRCGFWNVSVLSHAVWSAYLIGGLVMTLVLLSLRQYDFVWATTVLSPATFVSMTDWLGAVPAALGIAVPDTSLAYQSRLGTAEAADGARVLWSNLLLSSLVLWGILPRLLLLAGALLARGRAQASVSANLASPYYVGLRQRLLSKLQSGSIVDADDKGAVRASVANHAGLQSKLPASYAVAAIYPDPSLPWPATSLNWQENLGVIDDAASEATVLDACRRTSSSNLILCVNLSTVPDRGIRRLISAVKTEFSGRLYLGLLLTGGAEATRLEDWYALAAGLDIPLDDLLQLPVLPAARVTV